MPELVVLTLNSWGLRILSKNLDERMLALGDALAEGHYDIVCLQEIWSLHYYEIICNKVKNVLPYTHYFYSGAIGSGCATLSRYPIVDAFFQSYLHNGYFWDVLHADWFGGKGIGCVVVKHPHKKIHVFNTHLHADYHCGTHGLDECRTLQCYQLSQFVRKTTNPGDAVIVCGDLNHTSDSLGIRSLLELSKLNDSYEIASVKPEDCFTLIPGFNIFSDEASDCLSRIDYILASNAFGCSSCNLALQKIPNTNLHYSDHEGYTATLQIKEDVNNSSDYTDGPASCDILKQLLKVITKGEQVTNAIHWKKVYFLLSVFFMLILLPVLSIDTFHSMFPAITTWMGKCIFIAQVISIVFCVIYLWVNVIVRWTDVRAFRNISSEIKVKLSALQEINDKKVK